MDSLTPELKTKWGEIIRSEEQGITRAAHTGLSGELVDAVNKLAWANQKAVGMSFPINAWMASSTDDQLRRAKLNQDVDDLLTKANWPPEQWYPA